MKFLKRLWYRITVKEVYVVWAYRYADTNAYNFPVGTFNTYPEAVDAAHSHRQFRGFKYDHRIYKMPIGKRYDAQDLKPVRGFVNPINPL